jgi:hypothetical protein
MRERVCSYLEQAGVRYAQWGNGGWFNAGSLVCFTPSSSVAMWVRMYDT